MARRTLALALLALACIQAVQVHAEEAAPPPLEQADDTPSEPAPVILEIAVDSAIARLVEVTGTKKEVGTAKFGQRLLSGTEVGPKHSLEVVFTPSIGGTPARLQQAMLLLVPDAAPGLAAYAIAKAKKDNSEHVISVTVDKVEQQLGLVGGTFTVSLLLGDPAAAQGVRWELGTLSLPEPAGGSKPAPKHLTAGNQPTSNYQPDIVHMFRPKDKQPPALVSMAFSGLAVAPLAVLVLLLFGPLNANFQAWPQGAAGLWALLFHGSIAAVLGLYLLFWLRLNLAQTLLPALGLGGAVAVTGYQTLSAVSSARLAAGSSKASVAKKQD